MGKPKANRRISERERGKRGGSRAGAPPRTGMARDVTAVVLLALGRSSRSRSRPSPRSTAR